MFTFRCTLSGYYAVGKEYDAQIASIFRCGPLQAALLQHRLSFDLIEHDMSAFQRIAGQ